MSVASLGAIVAAALCAITAPMGREAAPTLLFTSALLVYICCTTVALVRREFHAVERTPYRWRTYLWSGTSFAVVSLAVVSYSAVQQFAFGPPISRITFIGFATAISLITAGSITRHYMLPLSIAVRAAYTLREGNIRTLKALTNGDERLATDVENTLKRETDEDRSSY